MTKIILGGIIVSVAALIAFNSKRKLTYQEVLGPCMPKGGDGNSLPCPAWIQYGKSSN